MWRDQHNYTILRLKEGAGRGVGAHWPERFNIVKKRFLSLNMYLSNLFQAQQSKDANTMLKYVTWKLNLITRNEMGFF